MTCKICQGLIETGRDFELAWPEFAQHFPRMPREAGHQVCDGCYHEMLGMLVARRLGPLKARLDELIVCLQETSGLSREWLELSDAQVKWIEAERRSGQSESPSGRDL